MIQFSVIQKLTVTLVLLMTISSLVAQKHNNVWIFGENAGVDFNTDPPTPISDAAIFSREPNATISDAEGNLLFYTDGITVYNKSHQMMMNGDGLMGGERASQTLIIQNPASSNLYYIFTVDDSFSQPPLEDGLRYSTADISMDNGLGAITEKNVLLENPVTEKLEAVYHANGTDVWVLAHRYGSNEFLSYLVTSTGVTETPVVSAQGLVYGVTPNLDFEEADGYLTANLQGTMLASVYTTAPTSPVSGAYVELLPFDNSTGEVGESLHVLGDKDAFGKGVVFSPDGTKLYMAGGPRLYQMDLSLSNTDDIWNNKQTLFAEAGALATSPDGCEIYLAGGFLVNSLHRINKPNELCPACDLEMEALVIPNIESTQLGLPTQLNGLPSGTCNPTGIFSPIKTAQTLEIFPNPVLDILTVNLPQDAVSIQMANTLGQILSLSVIEFKEDQYQLEVNTLTAGIYFLEVKNERGERFISKFIKE